LPIADFHHCRLPIADFRLAFAGRTAYSATEHCNQQIAIEGHWEIGIRKSAIGNASQSAIGNWQWEHELWA